MQTAAPAQVNQTALSQLVAEVAKNQPGIQTTEFYLVAVAVIAIFILASIGKLPASWAGVTAILVPAAYQYLRNTRKDDRETSLLTLIDTLASTAPALTTTDATKLPEIVVNPPATAINNTARPASDQPSTINPGAAAVSLLLVVALLLPGCGTPLANGVANVLESPATQTIISLGVQAGVNSLVAEAGGGGLPPEMMQPLTAAAGAAATGILWTGVYAGAEALRTKQSTSTVAKPGALTAALVNQAGLPQSNAAVVAQSVAALVKTGIPPDRANEAVAATLDGVAAAKTASPVRTGKSIVPLGKATEPAARLPYLHLSAFIFPPSPSFRHCVVPAFDCESRALFEFPSLIDPLNTKPDLNAFEVILA